ncbi:hypothetical protein CR513_03674, partial [Mucuna pruriens]
MLYHYTIQRRQTCISFFRVIVKEFVSRLIRGLHVKIYKLYLDNDIRIQYLKKRLLRNSLERLKDIDDYILRILVAVRYIISFPSRFIKFKEFVEQQNIEYKDHIYLDVET